MKKWIYLVTLTVIVGLKAFAQNPASILAPRYGGSSGYLPLPAPGSSAGYPFNGYDGRPAERVQNIQVDAQGNILFFIIDGAIFNRQGNFFAEMQIGSHIMGGNQYVYSCIADGTTEINVVPVPNTCHEYYLITNSCGQNSGTSNGQRDMAYGKIHIEYTNNQLTTNSGIYKYQNGTATFETVYGNSGFGWLTPLTTFNQYHWNQGNLNAPSIRTAVSKTNSAGKKYLFLTGSDHLWRYEITSQGIINPTQLLDYASQFGSSSGYSQNYESERGEMEVLLLSTGNYRLAYPFNRENNNNGNAFRGIIVMDLDQNATLLSNTIKTQQYTTSRNSFVRIRGLEFSPNGSKLYVTHSSNVSAYNNAIDQLDVSGSSITRTALTATGMSDFDKSHIEINSSGELILVNGSRIAKITNADATWNNSNWTNNTLNLGFTYNLSQFPVGSNQANSDQSYILQDQLDQDNYTLPFNQNPLCCVAYQTYDKEFFTSTSSGTWSPGAGSNPITSSNSSVVYIEHELRIAAGQTITINNMVFHFAPGARVVIENGSGNNGGKLILNNTTFTVDNRCGANLMWKGVEVWGNSNVGQGTSFSSTQGWLILNNSKIEHAHVGVLLSQRSGNQLYVFNDARNGGVVQTNGSILYNNMRGVWFRKYLPPSKLANNLSFFKTTTFNWVGNLIEGTPKEHLRMESVIGITVLGCNFKQTAPSGAPTFTRGYGILSREAQFQVNAFCPTAVPFGTPCPNPVASTFDSLIYGVYASNSNILTFKVQKSNFKNCNYGIYAYGTQKEQILQNEFLVAELNNQTAGIVLSRSTGYKVEENTLHEMDNLAVANGQGNSRGIVVINSGTAHNEIYKNTFYNLRVGGQSDAINGVYDQTINGPSRKGLQWKCNDFKSLIYEADLGVHGTIDYNQGFLVPVSIDSARLNAARNIFSMTNENAQLYPDHDIKVHPSSNIFQYIYLLSNGHQPDNYTGTKVAIAPAQALGNPVYSTSNFSECPTKIGSTLTVVKSKLMALTDELLDLEEFIAAGNHTTSALEALEKKKNQLMCEKQETYSFYVGSAFLADSTETRNELYDYYFQEAFTDSSLLVDYLEMRIHMGILDNSTILNALNGKVSAAYLSLIAGQTELNDASSIDVELNTNASLLAGLNALENNENSLLAYRAKALLSFVVDEIHQTEEFLPLDTRSSITTPEEKNTFNSERIVLYPNPSTGVLNFAMQNIEATTIEIQVFDITGSRVHLQNSANASKITVDCSALQSGTYIVKVYADLELKKTLLVQMK